MCKAFLVDLLSESVRPCMKAVLLTVAAGLAAMVMATPSGIASDGCRARAVSQHTARVTIKFLHVVDKPIGTRACDLAYGSMWDVGYATLTGMGFTMVIDAHGLTPVPAF